MVDSVNYLSAHRSIFSIASIVIGAGLATWIAQFFGVVAGFGVVALIATAGAAYACNQTLRAITRSRYGWQVLTLACWVWCLIALLISAVVGQPYVNLLQVGTLIFLVLWGIGSSRVIFANRLRTTEHEEWIDGALAGIATVALSVEFLIEPLYNRFDSSATGSGYATDVAIQCCLIAILIILTLALASGVIAIRDETIPLLLGSLFILGVCLAYTGGLATAIAHDNAGIPATGWVLSSASVIVAMWAFRHYPRREHGSNDERIGAYFRRIGGVASISALAVTIAAVQSAVEPGVNWFIVAAALGTGMLIAARLVHAGTITERLLQRTRERDRLASALNLSPELIGTLDLERLLPAIAATAATAIERTHAEVTLFAQNDRAGAVATFGVSDDEREMLNLARFDRARELAFVAPTETVWNNDDPTLPSSITCVFQKVGKETVLLTPIRARGQTLGLLEVWTAWSREPFSDDDVRVISAIAREGGFALHNALLLEATLASVEERSMLLRVTQAATSSLDLETVLAEIAQASLGIASTECCSILLLDEESRELIIGADQTVLDWPGVEPPGTRFPVDRFGSDMQVIAARQPRRYDQTSPELSESERAHLRIHGTESLLVVPLVAGEKCLGTLNLLSRQPGVFDDNAFRLGVEIAGQTALAIQHARLLAETQHYAEEQSILLRVSMAATSSLELIQVLEEITLASLDIPGAESCAILLWDKEANDLEMGFESIIPDWPGVDAPGTRYTLEGFAFQQSVVSLRHVVVANDDDPRISQRCRASMAVWGARSLLLSPLLVGDECLGIFQCYSRRRDAFGPVAVRLGRDIAAQSALAVHNARLLSESRRQADELAARLRVSQAVSSSLQLEEVLAEVARASLGVAGAECCEIELWFPERDETILAAQQTVPDWPVGSLYVGKPFPIGHWPSTQYVIETQRPYVFGTSAPDLTDYERQIVFSGGTKSGFAVPIVVENQSLGILSLFSRQPHAFSSRALLLGQDLASQAALAIERARLHAALQERARADALTGLLNRGAIEDALRLELTRARRATLPLAVLLIDLDGFKHVNDEHGHLMGDRVLQHTANLLEDSVREGDFVGRYGGDEFLVILPNADQAGALITVERILIAAEMTHIRTDGDELELLFRLSIGASVYPTDGSDPEELIAAADRAMYSAKPTPRASVTDFQAARRSRTDHLRTTAGV